MCILKNVFLFLILAVFAVLPLGSAASAGPLAVRVNSAVAGDMNGFKQSIVLSLAVKNTSSHECIRRLNYVEAEVAGDTGRGIEVYKRRIDVNFSFNPPLGPGDSKKITARFTRRVNPNKGWYRFRDVSVRVHSASFSRAR